MMIEQVVPSAVTQCVIVKFLTDETVKAAEILTKLRSQFGGETLSTTQVTNGQVIQRMPNKG
jgi:hypothetical protein